MKSKYLKTIALWIALVFAVASPTSAFDFHTGVAGGSDTEVQFNDGGQVAGDTGLVFNKTTDTLSLGKVDTKTLKWAKGADVASANALVLGADGNYFDITGVTSITSIGSLGIGSFVILHFDGILTLTHDATDLILPGAANITTAAGDEAMFEEYATGDWRCVNYSKADGLPRRLILPLVNEPASPTLAFGDGDSGFYQGLDNYLHISVGGTARFYFTTGGFNASTSAGAGLKDATTSATNPTVLPHRDDGDTGLGRATTDQLSHIVGGVEAMRNVEFNSKPYTIIGGIEIANLTTCTFPTANKNQISKTGVGTNLAVGDLVLVTAGTNATLDTYRTTIVNSADLITVDRDIHSHGSDITNGAVTTVKDGILIASTDGTNGQRIMNYSHQDKPLQIGGDVLAATGHSLGSEDVLMGGKLEVDDDVFFDRQVMLTPTDLTVTTEANMPDPLITATYLITGDDDSDNDAIDLQNGTTAGQILYLIAVALIDADDTITINMADTTCTNCPAIVFDKIGENAALIWTGSIWTVIGLQSAL